MKRHITLIAFLFIALSSCSKLSSDDPNLQLTPVDPVAQAAKDDAAIQSFITTNKITATKDASGLYYSILTPGSGTYPVLSSTITVSYTGGLLNGTVFDSSSASTFVLSSLIKGWQIGIPHINSGGTILLMIPSAQGYGNNIVGNVPPNSVLIFTITLNSFQ